MLKDLVLTNIDIMIKVIKFNKAKFNFKKVVDNYFYKKFKVTSKICIK